MSENTNLVLIGGKSATGKSACLADIRLPEGVMYLNCENNKRLPFKSKFNEYTVTDPMQVYEAFTHAETQANIHTIVIDSLTYLMDMYESLYVLPHAGTKKGMSAWGEYAQFLKQLMSQYVATSTKNIVFLAHTSDVINEADMINETLVKVKGSLMNQGVESFFSTVVSSKKVPTSKLDGFKSPYLNFTEEEEMLGFKYVFQTRLTKDTVNERMRSPMGMWDVKETFIDNNVQHIFDRLHDYYGTAP